MGLSGRPARRAVPARVEIAGERDHVPEVTRARANDVRASVAVDVADVQALAAR